MEDSLFAALRARIPADWQISPHSQFHREALLSALSAGNHLVWIGPLDGVPPDLWMGSFEPSKEPLSLQESAASPVPLPQLFQKAVVHSAYLKPAKEMPYHNQDEELRADLEPLLEARDRFGRTIGYPAVLLRHSAPSFVRHRFDGSEQFFFLFDHPLDALNPDGWASVLASIAAHLRTGLQLAPLHTNFAAYPAGERVSVRAQVRNIGLRMAAATLRCLAKAPGESAFREVDLQRRVADSGGASEAEFTFVPHGPPGLWTVRVELLADPAELWRPAISGKPVPIDRREIGFVLLGPNLRTGPKITLDGPRLLVNGKGAFLAGTNYYPSTSWWEWLWRDFRPLLAAQDFASMRRTGYGIIRIWAEPELDEQTLRAIDAAIYLAGQHGLLVDICLFTQWVRHMAYERPDHTRVRFEFRGARDFNVYGISFRNLQLQREYAAILARRWREADNVIFNLANETYVKDPDATQMDPEARRWPEIPHENSVLRDSLLFRAWARDITGAIRATGARQPILPGYIFAEMNGGDAYLAQRDGDIAAWHSYSNFDHTFASLDYVDPSSSRRPLLLEEMGTTGWNKPDVYDALAHAALAAGTAGVMSYEWGVRWLATEMSFAPVPLREVLDGTPDPRWFRPLLSLTAKWSPLSPGFHPAPSGLFYGSIYSGTPFPAEAAIALGRLGIMGDHLQRGDTGMEIYVVIPTARPAAMPQVTAALKKLAEQSVIFGVIQEDAINRLPPSARVLLCVTPLRKQVRPNLEVRTDPAHWLDAPLPRIDLQPKVGIQVTAFPTVDGMLYSLESAKGSKQASLRLHNQEISLGVSPYGLVHQTPAGCTLVEAAGEVRINGTLLARVSRGRMFLASGDGRPLEKAQRIRLLGTEPAEVTLGRPVRAVTALEPGGSPAGFPVPIGRGEHRVAIDDQLVRYELIVELDPNLSSR